MKKLKVFFIIYIIIFIFSCNKVFAKNNEKKYEAPKELGKCYYASNSNYNNELYDSILSDILSLKKHQIHLDTLIIVRRYLIP
ncbi:hypothetical protein [Clostridium niameyense]|uniref:hypothetical protein n=1 Tax=Clostridium niameyense TaxID=1622073 RepID=UPI00067EA5B8|nr:hypothetical protein [Clostridium niameyense]